MTRDARHIAIVAVLAILVALLGGVAGWCMRGEKKHPLPVADTVVITTTDTVTLVGPRDTLVRIVWKPYPVAIHDTTWITRHTTDSVFISLPYQYRHLTKPDTIDVWYSGVDPRIDSIMIYNRETTKIIRQPYELPKMPRLTAGFGCGAFYQEKRVNAYLFGEMRYNATKTTFGTFAAIDPTGQWCAGATVSYRINLIR